VLSILSPILRAVHQLTLEQCRVLLVWHFEACSPGIILKYVSHFWKTAGIISCFHSCWVEGYNHFTMSCVFFVLILNDK
jgi:hypothetical protein